MSDQTMTAARTLRRGDDGPDVCEWQYRLVSLGFPVEADGIFGAKTEAATKALQRSRGIAADGVVGPMTRAVARADVAQLPASWQRWHGARPEPRGAPDGSILAVRGIERISPEARSKLLGLCSDLGIPIDSMVTVISSESGFRPGALNPLPAAGLIQLTVGAGLPGFRSAAAVRSIVGMSAEEQIDRVVRPYYERMRGAVGAHPGHLYMLNFLPADADEPEDFALGIRDAAGWRGKVYAANPGFDRGRKGYITVGDVYAVAASVCKTAEWRRITADGEEA